MCKPAIAKNVLKTITPTCKLWPVLNGVICPQILYDIVLYALYFLFVMFFSSVLLIKHVSSYRKMWSELMNNARDNHKYKHEWGKIGPSYLLSENGDLSFLLCFSKQCLVENFQGKFKKNSSVNLISEESP